MILFYTALFVMENSTPVDRDRILNLLGQLRGGPTLEWFDAVIDSIKALDRKATLEILKALLSYRDGRIRFDAADVLLHIDAPRTLEMVLPLLEDPSAEVRYNITYCLAFYPDHRAIQPLIKTVLNDLDPDVRFNAVGALMKIGSREALVTLEWVKLHDHAQNFEGDTVSSMAERAIQKIIEGDDAAVSGE
jgi:HEAT repeat protein